MQSKRTLNVLRKRAGSLSNEKIHKIEMDMINEENHLKRLSKPLTRTQVNDNQLTISNRDIMKNDHTIDNDFEQEHDSNLHPKKYDNIKRETISKNSSNGDNNLETKNEKTYNNHKKASVCSNESMNKKSTQMNGWVMLPETKKLLNDLDMLNLDEKRSAMVITEEAFIDRVKQEIDCVGCSLRLQSYLRELAEMARSKGKILNFEGFLILPEARITIAENHLDNTIGIAQLLQYHKSRSFLLENLNKNLNIKKKNEGYMHKTKVHHRCFLHSKKPMPNSVWREALQNLIENHLPDIAALTEIEETTYILNLQNHLKKRKFCFTCKENIICAYENMIEEASKYSDVEDEELIDEDGGEMIETSENQTEGHMNCNHISSAGNIVYNSEQQYLDESESLDNNEMLIKHDSLQHIPGKIPQQAIINNNNNSNNINNNNYEYCDENEGHYEEEKVGCETTTNNATANLISYIRFCPERRKLIIPLEMEAFTEFLSKAEVDLGMQAKHAVTREAAQEELLICLGFTLKEKLQALWRYKKSEEMIKLLFLRVNANCFTENIENAVHNKSMKLGNKTIIEEYLKDIDAAEELKRQKLKQKRMKKKEKKKMLKMSQINTALPNENNPHGSQTPKNSKITLINGIKSANFDAHQLTSPGSMQFESQSPRTCNNILKFESNSPVQNFNESQKNNNMSSSSSKGLNTKSTSSSISNRNNSINNNTNKSNNTIINITNNTNNNSNKKNINMDHSINKDKKDDIKKGVNTNTNINMIENQIPIKKQKMKKITNGKVEVIELNEDITSHGNITQQNYNSKVGKMIINPLTINNGLQEEDKFTRSNKFDESLIMSHMKNLTYHNKRFPSKNDISNNNNGKLNDQIPNLCYTSSSPKKASIMDREAKLLKSMGWTEHNSEDNIEIDENEINQLKKKWREIIEHRDIFRKNARENFKRFIANASKISSL